MNPLQYKHINNRCRFILDNVGEKVLNEIIKDTFYLLDTTAVVFESNGDVAVGICGSSWCNTLDKAFRNKMRKEKRLSAAELKTCHCHLFSCSKEVKKVIRTGKPCTSVCNGGHKIYTIPIFVKRKVVGAMNFGYGNPPKDSAKIKEIAKKLKTDFKSLQKQADDSIHKPLPLINVAKKQLHSSAKLIEEIINRKLTEKSLSESERKYKELFETISCGFILFKLQRNKKKEIINFITQEVNKEFLKITKLSKKKLVGQPINKHFPKSFKAFFRNIIDGLNSAGFDNFEGYIEEINKWLKIRYHLIDNDIMAVIIDDITAIKNSESSILESEEKYRRAVQAIPLGMHMYAFNEKIGLVFNGYNKAADEILKIDHSKLLGKPILDAFPGLEHTEIPKRYEMLALNKDAITFTDTSTEYEDDRIKGAFEIYAFQTSHGRMAVMFNEISGRIKSEQELIEAKNKAEEHNRLKSAFLANMSHEIRTPMNGILGFVELLENPNYSNEERYEFIKIIKDSGTHLLQIVNDIIDISKIEAGIIELHETPACINELLDTTYTFYKPVALEKKLALHIHKMIAYNDSYINVDIVKLQQIIDNLISNAIKFTDTGDIIITCSKKDQLVEISVEDTGIGIDPNMHEVIFEQFRQSTMIPAGKNRDTGLGLSIARAYIKKMGGSITVSSEPGKGSKFIFTIPHKPADIHKDDNENLSVSNKKQKDATILVIEDDKYNFMLIKEILKHSKIKIIRTVTAKQALVSLDKHHKTIDLILMDIRLSDMNGYELIKKIRFINPFIPVIAQTAYAMQEDIQKGMDCGFNEYISKPIKQRTLLSKIHKYI